MSLPDALATAVPEAGSGSGSGNSARWVEAALLVLALGVLGGILGLVYSVLTTRLGPSTRAGQTRAGGERLDVDPAILGIFVIGSILLALAVVAGPLDALVIFTGAVGFLALAKHLPEANIGLLIAAGPLQSSTYAALAPLDLTLIALAGVVTAIIFRLNDPRYRRRRLYRQPHLRCTA